VSWRKRFDRELEAATQARRRGNEGQARVCARRAAGIVAAEFYARRGDPPSNQSAIDLLQRLAEDPSLPANIASVLSNLLRQVDLAFTLPHDVDLIEDAHRLRQDLLPDEEP
jgi:HEPN domain-containing protein